jgi:hypothetical protein
VPVAGKSGDSMCSSSAIFPFIANTPLCGFSDLQNK